MQPLCPMQSNSYLVTNGNLHRKEGKKKRADASRSGGLGLTF